MDLTNTHYLDDDDSNTNASTSTLELDDDDSNTNTSTSTLEFDGDDSNTNASTSTLKLDDDDSNTPIKVKVTYVAVAKNSFHSFVLEKMGIGVNVKSSEAFNSRHLCVNQGMHGFAD